jgi:hypothetical protein
MREDKDVSTSSRNAQEAAHDYRYLPVLNVDMSVNLNVLWPSNLGDFWVDPKVYLNHGRLNKQAAFLNRRPICAIPCIRLQTPIPGTYQDQTPLLGAKTIAKRLRAPSNILSNSLKRSILGGGRSSAAYC